MEALAELSAVRAQVLRRARAQEGPQIARPDAGQHRRSRSCGRRTGVRATAEIVDAEIVPESVAERVR